MQDEILAILFDMDGTLYSSQFSISGIARKLLNQLGLVHVNEMSDSKINRLIIEGPEAWLKQYMLANNVQPKWQPYNELWIEYCRCMLQSFEANNITDEMSAELKSRWTKFGPPGRGLFRPQLVDGADIILKELQVRGYRLGISTNRFYNPEPVLEEDSIAKYFSCVEHTGVPGYSKPSPYMLLNFASQVEVNPLKCAVIGDQVDTDVRAALNAGMTPILANWNSQFRRNSYDDLLVVDQIEDLLCIFPEV